MTTAPAGAGGVGDALPFIVELLTALLDILGKIIAPRIIHPKTRTAATTTSAPQGIFDFSEYIPSSEFDQ
jgi:hypothetical protein